MNEIIQRRTSANTSINKTKIPTAFTKITPSGCVCDYGCGKYVEHIRAKVLETASGYFPFDPCNQSCARNELARYSGERRLFDMVYMCNVLNVIDSIETIRNVVYTGYNWLRNNGKLVIQIYEGDRTGIGRQTKIDCYQRNELTSQYLRNIYLWFGECASYDQKGNILIITKKSPK